MGTESGIVLVINPGSTSTKLALYRGLEEIGSRSVVHSSAELSRFIRVSDQLGMRMSLVQEFLASCRALVGSLAAVMARGGLLRPLPGGVFRISQRMVEDLSSAKYGEHASNLGALLGWSIGVQHGCPAYIADPVVVDELVDEARLSGLPELPRRSIFHALNQRMAAREAASKLGLEYSKASIIVAHLGGGISVGMHLNGRVVDVNNALDGEGPFSPERSGTLPAADLVRLAYSGTISEFQLLKRITGGGGLVSYCNTNDLREVRRRQSDGDVRTAVVIKAMVLQIAKEIAAVSVHVCGKPDAVVLTGGMAYDGVLVDDIKTAIQFLGIVLVIPGEREMLSLAENAQAVLSGEREVCEYV